MLIVLIIDAGLNFLLSSFPFAESLDGIKGASFTENWDVYQWFTMAIIVAPLFETALFQWLIIKVSKWLFKSLKINHYIFPVIISGGLFGLNHFYNITYILITSLTGFIFAFLFVIVQKRKECAYFIVVLTHSLHNMIPFMNDFVFNNR